MYILKDWYVDEHTYDGEKVRIAHGDIFNNPRFNDGVRIRTSNIKKAEAMNDYIMITTANSVYQLAFNQYKPYYKEKLGIFLRLFGLNDCLYRKIILSTKNESKRLRNEISREIKSGQFYMIVSGITPRMSYFKDENQVLHTIQPYIHGGIYQDSVLFRKTGVVDLRFFPRLTSIDFYHVSENINSIKIKNIGRMIQYSKTLDSNTIKITTNDTVELTEYDLRDKKCMLSPDVHNKKIPVKSGEIKTPQNNLEISESSAEEDENSFFFKEEPSKPANRHESEKLSKESINFRKFELARRLLIKKYERGEIDFKTYDFYINGFSDEYTIEEIVGVVLK